MRLHFRPSIVKNCVDTFARYVRLLALWVWVHTPHPSLWLASYIHWVWRNSRIKYICHTNTVFPYSPHALTDGAAHKKSFLKAVRGTLASGTWTGVIAKTWACVRGVPINKAEQKPNTHHSLFEPCTTGCQSSQQPSNLIYAKTKTERQLLLMGIKINSSQAA